MRFWIKKLGVFMATLFVVALIAFVVFRLIPGDPALIILGVEADQAAVAQLHHELGLDQPLYVQFWRWLGQLLRGDLGRSLRLSAPVGELLWQRLPVTTGLAALSIIIATGIAIPVGILAATHRGGWLDLITMALSQVGIAIPAFWAGIILLLVFSMELGWFAPGGFVPFAENPWLALKSLILPSLALGLQRAAILTRMTRASMLDVLRQDYMRTAQSKGLSERVVLYRHGLKNAIIPVLTVLGMHLGGLLAGSIVIEQVFNLPGVGQLTLMAVNSRDLPLAQGLVMFTATIIILLNFTVDLLYSRLDPRIRYQ